MEENRDDQDRDKVTILKLIYYVDSKRCPTEMRTCYAVIFFFSLSAWTSLARLEAAPRPEDHLVPFRPSVYDELRPSLYRKLCVTPANYGRMIELPAGPERGEWAVSVSCDEASATGQTCDVTLTRAAANLDYIMQDRRGKDPLKAVNKVKVVRKRAPIQKTAAAAVRAAWSKFLRNSKPSLSRPNDPIALDGATIEFWLVMPGGKVMKAETPDRPGKLVATLANVGRSLAEYCEAPESQRAMLAARIELAAKRLAGRSLPKVAANP